MRVLVLLASLLVSVASLATEAPAPDQTTAPTRPRVLVLEPASKAFDAATTSTIAGLLIVELAKDSRLDVISTAEVRRLAELEGDKQAVGCGDTNCLAELAGAMGARYVIFGDVGSLGSLVVLNLNLFDGQTTQAIHRVTVQADGIANLPGALPTQVAALRTALLASARPGSTTTTTTTSEILVADPPQGGSIPILPWALVGTGFVIGALGVAGDVLLPTSKDGVLGGIDFVWPAAWLGVAPIFMGVGGGMLLFAATNDANPGDGDTTAVTGGR